VFGEPGNASQSEFASTPTAIGYGTDVVGGIDRGAIGGVESFRKTAS